MTQETETQKSSRKNGMSRAIGRIAIAAALLADTAAYEPRKRGEIRAEDVTVKPARNGRYPYLSNHPCGSRQAKRSAAQKGGRQ